MVKVLVAAGADVNALSYCGDTPLHLVYYPESAETLLRLEQIQPFQITRD